MREDGSGRSDTRSALRQGVLDALPLMLGYAPFGLILGTTFAASPISDLAGWASSWLVFAGASQLAIVDLLSAQVPVVVVIATALVVNLRHMMYSGAIAPWFRDAPRSWRLAAPFLLVDPVYSMSMARFPHLDGPRAQRVYYATLGLLLYGNWIVTSAVGILLGSRLPASLDISLAVPLVFLALLVPAVTDRPALLAAFVGAAVGVAGQGWPLGLGLLGGVFAGIAAGVIAATVQERRA